MVVARVTESCHDPTMTYSSTLTSKNQTTLPKAVVAALKARPSAKLSYELLDDGSVKLSAKTATFDDLVQALPRRKAPKKRVTIEMMDQAIRDGAARRYRRAVS